MSARLPDWLDPATPADGEFRTFAQWVSRARSWIGGTGAVCVDARDRRCEIGRDFMRADDDDAFPVRFYFPPERRRGKA